MFSVCPINLPNLKIKFNFIGILFGNWIILMGCLSILLKLWRVHIRHSLGSGIILVCLSQYYEEEVGGLLLKVVPNLNVILFGLNLKSILYLKAKKAELLNLHNQRSRMKYWWITNHSSVANNNNLTT